MRRFLLVALLGTMACASSQEETNARPSPGSDASVGDVAVEDGTQEGGGDAPTDSAADVLDAGDETEAPMDSGTDVPVDGTPDGDGGECSPSCGAGEVCEQGSCVCDPAMPTGWPATISPWIGNPMLVPTSATANQGSDNIYAPEIHAVGGARVMWYGAQGSDGHDRVYVAYSSDGMEWRKVPSDQAPVPALEAGGSNHVNDPSVVRVGSTYRMYYTDAPTAELDRIWLAESSSITGFAKVAEVLGPGAPGSWEEIKVGRPSVVVEGGVTHMWYDGTGPSGRHVGYATSTDGLTFERHPSNPVFLNAGAVDVKKVGGVYVMLREAGDGTYWATSTEGTCWVDRGKLFGLSGAAFDAYGQVTPFLEVEGGGLKAVWFGGASVATWNKNRIGVAFPGGTAVPAGGGCSGCTTWGWSCSTACQAASLSAAGQCGSPGSTNPGACCNCLAEGCEACAGATDCHAACVLAGKPGGWCAHPGSSDPATCCACLD